jgi:crotonobetainyl-CoA:carnitine CoA-transferase CaiB-like acyl-CoA transferase
MSGIMRTQAGSDEADSPVFLTVPVNDVIAAGLATLGACAALAARARTGRGQRVSVSLCAASCLVQSEHLVRFAGRPAPPGGGRDFPGPGPLDRLYRAADGWVRLAGVGQQAKDGLAEVVAGLPVAEVLRRAASTGVPAVKARQAAELAGDLQLIRHGLLTVIEPGGSGAAAVAGPGHGLELRGLDRPPPGLPPRPGEHSRAILLEAGLDPGEVERLERTGVVFSRGVPG